MGIFGVVFIVLLILKIFGLIASSWLFVFSPIFAWMALWLFIIILALKNEGKR